MLSRPMVILDRFTRYPFLYIFGIGAYAVAASTLAGRSLGLHNLFLEDDGAAHRELGFILNRPSFNSQAALSLAVMFAWFVPAFAGAGSEEGSLRDKARRLVRHEVPWALALNVVVAGLVLVFQCAGLDVPAARAAQIGYSALGFAAGIVSSAIVLAVAVCVAHRLEIAPVLAFIGTYFVVLVAVLLWPWLIPAVSLFALLSLVSLAYVAIKLLPERWRLPAVASIFGMLVAGYSLSPRAELPGIERDSGESYYKRRIELPMYTKARVKWPTARRRSPIPGSVDPLEALNAWKASLGGRPAKLVVVATSGGAYRASFWTTLILDQIIAESVPSGRHPGLQQNIRLLTGASGGVVAAAYFAATRTPPEGAAPSTNLTSKLTADIEERQATQYKVPRDSLSAVAKYWIQNDIPSAFLPWMARPNRDRGVVLEEFWQTLDKTFQFLATGERTGWRPSLIISPMDINTGAPVLISNLDLRDMIDAGSEHVEFFDLYPEARRSFLLRTAVRMSATFPYVSPIVDLPTTPPVRIVDAGYYDNYGISTAIGFLRSPPVMQWLKDNVSGIMVVQIRANGIGAPKKRSSSCDAVEKAAAERSGPFTWLTGPLEGAAAGREVSMRVRNDQELAMLQSLYEGKLVQTVTFENTTQSSASWSLPKAEFDCFVEELKSDANQAAFASLEKWWKGEVVGSR
jgi:patatin-like phospholipase